MVRKKKHVFQTNYLAVRAILSAVILFAFFLTFFLGGGLDYFKTAAAIKNFVKYPFEIHFIDVGLGDSIFIRLPNNETMLIDCGPDSSDNTLLPYLTDLFGYENIDDIDHLVFTHQDADHVGKGKKVLDAFQVNNVYRPKVLSKDEVLIFGNPKNYKTSTTETYNNAIMAVYDEPNCEIHYTERGVKLYNSDFCVEFLSPKENVYSNSNNYSPMIMVTYQTRKFLLTGDGESEAEKEVINAYKAKLHADVLKVGHHGSNTSTSLEFLNYVQPTYAVISVSEENQYDFPKVETLGRLENVGAEIKSTSKLGSIAMSVDENNNLLISTSKGNIKIDLPLLVVITVITLILVWGIKVENKNNKVTQKSC